MKHEKYVTYLGVIDDESFLTYFMSSYGIKYINFVSSCILHDTVGIRFWRVIAGDAS
jgi:hypothetical protein